MIQLAEIFRDGMILQRQKAIRVFGTSDKKENVEVRINDELIGEYAIEKGDFLFELPAMEVAENITFQIGDISIRNVDIGEVYLAGGQSNMEFEIEFTIDGEELVACANDEHLRVYTVGQYSYEGEREEGYKNWHNWNRWLPYTSEYAKDFTAVGTSFARKLRKKGVPVGIVSCNWGGTSASAWIPRETLLAGENISIYVKEWDKKVASMDTERFSKIKSIVRPAMASEESQKTMGLIKKQTFRPGEFEKMMMSQQKEQSQSEENPLSGFRMEELMISGPGDPEEPGSLYENMVSKIVGYTLRGVLWYQGETDEVHPEMYSELFTALIQKWRKDFMDELPFLFVQLAPYGEWRNSNGDLFPILRNEQEKVSKTITNVYMTSISDLGNIYDIHPKEKTEVGRRLYLLAERYIYGENILADAPEASEIEHVSKDTIEIRINNAEGLWIKKKDFQNYNGFSVDEISECRPALLPPIVDGINGMKIIVDDAIILDAKVSVSSEKIVIISDSFVGAGDIQVKLGQRGFYEVNIYNRSGIPMKPFTLRMK